MDSVDAMQSDRERDEIKNLLERMVLRCVELERKIKQIVDDR